MPPNPQAMTTLLKKRVILVISLLNIIPLEIEEEMLFRLIGLALLLLGIYLLGQNIYFTTNVSPYWWRGIAADGSILFLTGGIVALFFFPSGVKSVGWMSLLIGILLVFISSRAILNPTSLWEFCLSIACFMGGYQLLTTGRLNL